jgi:uncharacterized RDD family membrane protein YckC
MKHGISLSLMAALGLLLASPVPVLSAGLNHEEMVSVGNDVELPAGDTATEVVVIGGDVKIAGNVEREVVVVGGDVQIDGDIGQQVVVVMGTVHLGPHAVLHRDLVTVGTTADIAAGATVEGRTQQVAVATSFGPFLRLTWLRGWFQNCVWKFRPLSLSVGFVWWFVVAFFILYLLIATLFPYPVECCLKQVTERPATTLAVGVMTKLLIPIICLILPFTVIGIFIVPFLIVGMFLTLLVGKVSVLEYLGGKFAGPGKAIVSLCLGALLITVLYLIPFFGLFVAIVFSCWGLGAAATAGWIALRRERGPVAPVPIAPISPAPPFPPPPSASSIPIAPPVVPPQAFAYPRAGFWERMGAGFLDLVLIGMATAWIGPLALLVAVAYFSGMWAWKGTTIGGIVLNLHVVREDGRPLSFLVAFVRSLASFFSIFALFLGFFWIGWDRGKQGWHDKIAGTVVVRLPKAIPLVCL